LVLVAVAHDNHNLQWGGPFTLEYDDEEGMPGMGEGWIVRFDAVPVYTDESIEWPDHNPPYNGTYKTDYQQFNEYELIFWVLNDMAVFGGDLSGLEDYDFLRVRIEDQAMDNSHGNWHRSGDLKDEALNFYTVLGVKAYQEFQGNYVEADYYDGPSFARDGNGVAEIKFALAVQWAGAPPKSVPLSATNMSDPYLPQGCATICNFYTYRLANRNSDEFHKLSTLFFGQPNPPYDCDDFYLRGSGLVYQGGAIVSPLFVVRDDFLSHDQEDEGQFGDIPILYMSHRDDLLAPEYQDDYSYSLACDKSAYGRALFYGDKRGEYNPDGNIKNVFGDLKLGGTGEAFLSTAHGGQTFISVQSQADLFIIDAHGAPAGFRMPDLPDPTFAPFHKRLDNGQASDGCTFFYAPAALSSFGPDTKWLAITACDQMNNESIPYYYSSLIATSKLLEIGGYTLEPNGPVTTEIAPYFDQIMAAFEHYSMEFWDCEPSGTRFVAGWMESHCLAARTSKREQYSASLARAIDYDYVYYLKHVEPRWVVLGPWVIQAVQEYYIDKEAM